MIRAKWLQGSVQQNRIGVGSEESSFEMPACQDMSLGAEELNDSSLQNWQVQNNGNKGIRL
jgi:hypothetical protein